MGGAAKLPCGAGCGELDERKSNSARCRFDERG
jgi:hypothetical protein